MAPEPTLRYPTLRRTRSALRVLAPIASTTALLSGIGMFAGVAPRLISVGYGPMERFIWGVIGIGYLIGAPILAFILFFLFRAAADLIDLWIDLQVSGEKTADLMERQLVPAVLRICQLLEKMSEPNSPQPPTLLKPPAPPSLPSATAGPANDARQRLGDSLRDAMRRESWDQARQLAATFAQKFPDEPEAKDIAAQVEAAFKRKVQSLREQLDHAEGSGDSEGMLNSRDRLSAYLSGTELYQVDRRVAHWMAKYLRDALAAGKAKDVVHLAERVVDSVGDSTQEGAQVRASLPALRRGAGLCPECGEPYDSKTDRCAACESKRRSAKATPGPREKPPMAPREMQR
jgi:hypothetical protein